jgi:hypothetical protein
VADELHMLICFQVWFQNMRARDRRRVVGTPSSFNAPSLQHLGLPGANSLPAVAPIPLIAALPSGFPSHSITMSAGADILLRPFVTAPMVSFDSPEQSRPLDLSTKIVADSMQQVPVVSGNRSRIDGSSGEDTVLDLSTRSGLQRNTDSPLQSNGSRSPANCVSENAADTGLAMPLDCSSTASSSSASSSSSAEITQGDSQNGWSSNKEHGSGQKCSDGSKSHSHTSSSPGPQDYSIIQRHSWQSPLAEKRKVDIILLLVHYLAYCIENCHSPLW